MRICILKILLLVGLGEGNDGFLLFGIHSRTSKLYLLLSILFCVCMHPMLVFLGSLQVSICKEKKFIYLYVFWMMHSMSMEAI